MEKFNNKYRIPSSRMQNWDYGSSAAYFITICTKNREHYFGEIENGNMNLKELGLIAYTEWEKTPGIRPGMNLELGEFVVMPNHFHAIITIGNGRDAMHGVSDGTNTSTQFKNKFGPQTNNLGSIIRGFKSSVTTHARKHHIEFGWHERFHDMIIRDHAGFIRVSNYIRNNPENWGRDAMHGVSAGPTNTKIL